MMAGWISAQGATVTWTNTAGGNWGVAANWSPNQVPGAADTGLITTPGTYTVTLSDNEFCEHADVGRHQRHADAESFQWNLYIERLW